MKITAKLLREHVGFECNVSFKTKKERRGFLIKCRDVLEERTWNEVDFNMLTDDNDEYFKEVKEYWEAIGGRKEAKHQTEGEIKLQICFCLEILQAKWKVLDMCIKEKNEKVGKF